ncbi:Multidrug efflux pump subunit AcrA (membrane-fusion protein) [Flexibacter flexilis DSM 6793]|uniref:Multidrug efflux pump subunit AcrA (Membrane-fusion protein) n=1 Tax=Flexibacter flexilis DSM 6793 TaxID=927664 RepID=A0A1I1GRV8_9BACT|nr:HlyD family efflux transporter periplasmic adaptor subunit [Flexibacter flexilis]SFC14032.1 Multidrug efflux pump subunit AcrA (membrane-fusion protein) [Flexibacter flexilis DSM 6793]
MKIIYWFFPIILLLSTACSKKKQQLVSPTFAPITEAIFASGYLEAKNQFQLTALNDGILLGAEVQEGQVVNTGQLLFWQDNSLAALDQKTAQNNLTVARAQAQSNSATLLQLKAQLTFAQQKKELDSIQLKKIQNLFVTKSVSKLDLDNAQLAYDNAISSLQQLENNIKNTKLLLNQALQNSQTQKQIADTKSDYFYTKSTGNYKVYSILKEKGEFVRKGEVLAILGNVDEFVVVLNVDEASIKKIQERQIVLLELNTEKGNAYPATISKIYPFFDQATQSYKVEAIFDSLPKTLINGTLLQANIIVAEKDSTLLIPRACLLPNGKIVIAKDGNEQDTLQIRTGIVSTEWVEVLSGVNIMDRLVKIY